MHNEIEAEHPRTPVLRKAAAGVILVAAVALAVKLLIGFLAAIFWTILAVALVVAIAWSLKTLLW